MANYEETQFRIYRNGKLIGIVTATLPTEYKQALGKLKVTWTAKEDWE